MVTAFVVSLICPGDAVRVAGVYSNEVMAIKAGETLLDKRDRECLYIIDKIQVDKPQ